MAVESYCTGIFKQFGIVEKEVFTPDEFLTLNSKYPKLSELKEKTDQKAQLEQSRAFFVSREGDLETQIQLAASPQKEAMQQELSSITAKKNALTQQIDGLTVDIAALKNEMGVK